MLASLLNTQQASRVFGLAPATLATMRVRGEGPKYVKPGRSVFYDPADLREWIEANKRRSTSE
jgi:predicted DNA-binding transcriptional regulator AlpA